MTEAKDLQYVFSVYDPVTNMGGILTIAFLMVFIIIVTIFVGQGQRFTCNKWSYIVLLSLCLLALGWYEWKMSLDYAYDCFFEMTMRASLCDFLTFCLEMRFYSKVFFNSNIIYHVAKK